MARSRADERLFKRVAKEAPDALSASSLDLARVVDRLLTTQPQSREERRAAKTKAAPPKR